MCSNFYCQMTLLQEYPIAIRSFRAGGVGWEGAGEWLVEYQNTRNKPSHIPKIILKLV